MKIDIRTAVLFTLLLSMPLFMSARKPGVPALPSLKLTGGIFDKETNENLGGAYLFVEELQKGIYSGPDGNYCLNGLQPGKYHITIKFISYHDKKISVKIARDKNNLAMVGLDPVQP